MEKFGLRHLSEYNYTLNTITYGAKYDSSQQFVQMFANDNDATATKCCTYNYLWPYRHPLPNKCNSFTINISPIPHQV